MNVYKVLAQSHIDINGDERTLEVEANQLCFTYCQVPIIYAKADAEYTEVVYNEDKNEGFNKLALNNATSNKIFDRTNEINHIKVSIIK